MATCDWCGAEIELGNLSSHRCAQMNQQDACGWNILPRDVKLLIGSYLPLQDIGKLATVDKTTRDSSVLKVINKEYWDKGADTAGTFASAQAQRRDEWEKLPYHRWHTGAQSAWSEMRTSRALFMCFGDKFRSWNELNEEQKKKYRESWNLESGGTPDYIVEERPADSFVVKVPGLGYIDDSKLKEKAVEAVHNSLRSNMKKKWSKYSSEGSRVIAIADISDFPETINTQEVVNVVLEDQEIKKIAQSYPNCSLLLLRECTITKIDF